ncbi:hypothetical protein N7509_008693 [Penicillium cosmopolitanum]|uniref:Arb2 domain-containing protein n=1 Tax=Penicillium cosmopolitanum TaxID=1131564 RepID=A0A9X0B2X8_9EURO|nr:uncharacterized protein N7509_008693 [Penicillium cosmopolitanum]KAJ5386152.1 hypothetical protein N7509_008693 [Penicillium cosmopolitanum]
MFIYRNKDLPKDPYYPSDLKKMGYFVTENDQIRKISDPEAGFQYKINRNDRFNVKNREAMNDCIRELINTRLHDAGLEDMRLPLREKADGQIVQSRPDEAHVPIMVSGNLRTASRIIVVFGEPVQDFGVWAYRIIGQEEINKGSAVDFARAVLGEDGSKTGNALVLANTGQLLWNCLYSRAVTNITWASLPRPAGNWGPPAMSWRTKIPGNKDWREHIHHVFNKVLRPCIREATRIDIIGMSEGGLGAIEYLEANWETWGPFISGICLGDPLQSTNADIDMSTLADPKSFTAFLSARCRAYVMSDEELGTRHSGYRSHGCNCYSSGESCYTECILPSAWRDMLHWLDMLYEDPSYEEQIMIIGRDLDENIKQDLEKLNVASDEDEDPETTQEDSQEDGGEGEKEDEKDAQQNTGGAAKAHAKSVSSLEKITEQCEDEVSEEKTI